MSETKRYQLSFEKLNWECIIEINESLVINVTQKITTADLIQRWIELGKGWKSRLRANEGDYTVTFLQQVANILFRICVENRVYSLSDVIEEFLRIEFGFKLDGSRGIKLVHCGLLNIEDSDFVIKHVSDAE